jgi:hypothetical protein
MVGRVRVETRGRRLVKLRMLAAVLVTGVVLGGACLSIPGQDTLFVKGEPFIIGGTAAITDCEGPRVVWYGDNGITYHLYQGTRLANDDFDRITTAGVTSRLELATRTDLDVSCRVGTIVEVQRVLEVVE